MDSCLNEDSNYKIVLIKIVMILNTVFTMLSEDCMKCKTLSYNLNSCVLLLSFICAQMYPLDTQNNINQVK